MDRLRSIALRIRNNPAAIGGLIGAVALLLGDTTAVGQAFNAANDAISGIIGGDAEWADYLVALASGLGIRQTVYGPVTVKTDYTPATAEHLRRELVANGQSE